MLTGSVQADQVHLRALKVQRKYYSEPCTDSQRWPSRHDQLVKADKGLPKQKLSATMLSMDYTRVWYIDKSCMPFHCFQHPQCLSPLITAALQDKLAAYLKDLSI
jgi:hypothetical protein